MFVSFFRFSSPRPGGRRLTLPLTWLACLLALPLAALAQPAATRNVTGRVSNAATGAYLQGATVAVPSLGQQTYTDGIGAFVLRGLPAGEHEIVVTYTGLDAMRRTVSVTPGETVRQSFDLTADVYELAAFEVTGEREGNAASITRQRNAANVRNVVALDAFGNLPNDSAGELLVRLPGVAGAFDDEGNVTGVSVRGVAPGFNTVSIDGNPQSSAGGFGRDFRTHNISGALFDEIEVVKSPTPDMPADSLGGAVNLKTKSPLNLKEKRRISYRAAARWAPSFFEHTPLRRDHPIHPLLSAGYQEVFDVFGGERNLGVSLDLFYSENVNGIDQTLLDYQYTTNSPAYVWDFRRQNGYNNRVQQSATLKLDYQLSETTRIFFNTIYNDAPERFNRLFTARAYTGRTVAAIGDDGQPTGTGAILPGWTDDVTEVRGVAASTVELNSTLYSFFDRQRQFHAGAIHELDWVRIDYDANYSHSKPLLESSYRGKDGLGGGIFTMDVKNVGWILDRSGSDENPDFTQTAGPDINDAASYSNGRLTSRRNQRFTTRHNASLNALFNLPTTFDSTIKTGLRWGDIEVAEKAGERRWDYVGAAPLSSLVDPNLELTYEDLFGNLPFIDSARIGQDIHENPQNWREDRYYAATRKYAGSRRLQEDITAAYVQGQARLGRFGLVTGVRMERTEFDGEAYVISRTPTTNAEREADPEGSAAKDYAGNLRRLKGDYTDYFPGIHLTYQITDNLQARASWSNSIGRPPGTSLLPTESISVTNETVTLGNPDLKPQHSENWDLALEYYFEPVGQFSVGYFRKDLSDFFVNRTIGTVATGPDNGFNGDYAGYEIIGPSNAGKAKIDGWELNYQQQFTFLPGIFRGLGFFANYTRLETSGDYGETGARSTSDVARFVPETANAGLTFNAGKFGSRVLYNYSAAHLWDYSADASRLRYRDDRTLVNLSLSYRIRPELTFFVDFTNLFNEPLQYYRALPERLERSTYNGTAMTFGISGRF